MSRPIEQHQFPVHGKRGPHLCGTDAALELLEELRVGGRELEAVWHEFSLARGLRLGCCSPGKESSDDQHLSSRSSPIATISRFLDESTVLTPLSCNQAKSATDRGESAFQGIGRLEPGFAGRNLLRSLDGNTIHFLDEVRLLFREFAEPDISARQ
jgi:hypothetical protein